MNVQVIMRDGVAEYAVLPWEDYQALLEACGRQVPVQPAPAEAPAPAALPGLTELAALREQQGLSQQDLARTVGISPAYLAMIERGERDPDDAIRRALARVFGVEGWERRA